MSIYTMLNLLLFTALASALFHVGKLQISLSRRVLAALIAGSLFGFYLQLVFGHGSTVASATLEWTNVVANVYVNLLRMVITPLVLITMMASVLKVEEIKALGRIGGSVLGMLLVTTMIAALVGMALASVFGLNAGELVSGARELARAEVLQSRLATDRSIPQLLSSAVPRNLFADLSETRDTSIIAVALFGALIGFAALLLSQENATHGGRIRSFVDTAQALIMRLVKLVISLTPYGVLALMTRVIAGSDGDAIVTLIGFVVASYLAIAIMFVIHGIFIALTGANVKTYYQQVWPVLTFAFVTRSSAATIPLTIRAQIEDLKIPVPIANISASFGATIGQNGCAGIYPAMLAVMVAPTMGIDINLGFIVSLLLIIAVGSFGIAGVGGGATNAALVVLPAMGFPVTVAALLISIEPLIDMARTALNVNGAITAGMVTTRLLSGREAPQEAARLSP